MYMYVYIYIYIYMSCACPPPGASAARRPPRAPGAPYYTPGGAAINTNSY